ncbi:putative uncharacterized protein DDB_G0282499 [Aphidius gifuensis]|uniref:putative uncharacterized protein DDB_G0282499 n=1 Tax=Aphidius gifuensis TaxID=684658 RepID=UPI001CDCE4DA|nr:putative uncharacterized protein DDB_G0282499 [Aphidius gifuensis]
MRRPGTLPTLNQRNNNTNINNSNNNINNINNNGIFMSSQSNDISDISKNVHNINTMSRNNNNNNVNINNNYNNHHSSHSLKRLNNNNQKSTLPSSSSLRESLNNSGGGGTMREVSVRIQNDDYNDERIYEQILSTRHHSPPCPQSSYPTLPINNNISHNYNHYRDNEISRERGFIINRDRELPIVPHRNDKHLRESRNPLELEIHGDGSGIGTYQA